MKDEMRIRARAMSAYLTLFTAGLFKIPPIDLFCSTNASAGSQAERGNFPTCLPSCGACVPKYAVDTTKVSHHEDLGRASTTPV